MTTTQEQLPPGPRPALLRFVEALGSALDKAHQHEPGFLRTEEKEVLLLELARQKARLEALELKVLATAGDVAERYAHRDAGSWLAKEARLDRGPTRRNGELAAALDRTWPQIGAALASGAVNLPQARVCVQVLGELADDVRADLAAAVAEQLVVLAEQWAPKDLRALGRRLLAALDPETADEREGRRLEEEERRAREQVSVTSRRIGPGRTRVVTDLPDAVANRFLTFLDAYASPRVSTSSTTGDGSTTGGPGVSTSSTTGDAMAPARVRRGRALMALMEHLDPAKLPAHGGTATTLMVTISLEDLRKKLAAGDVIGHDLGRMSAGEIRRLACSAGIIPVVLGGASEILDLGRSQRLFSTAQNRARKMRDKHCRAEGCDVPASWTEGHHRHPWAAGGRTDLRDAVSLCSFHHHLVHDDRYVVEYLPNGDVRYRRRT